MSPARRVAVLVLALAVIALLVALYPSEPSTAPAPSGVHSAPGSATTALETAPTRDLTENQPSQPPRTITLELRPIRARPTPAKVDVINVLSEAVVATLEVPGDVELPAPESRSEYRTRSWDFVTRTIELTPDDAGRRIPIELVDTYNLEVVVDVGEVDPSAPPPRIGAIYDDREFECVADDRGLFVATIPGLPVRGGSPYSVVDDSGQFTPKGEYVVNREKVAIVRDDVQLVPLGNDIAVRVHCSGAPLDLRRRLVTLVVRSDWERARITIQREQRGEGFFLLERPVRGAFEAEVEVYGFPPQTLYVTPTSSVVELPLNCDRVYHARVVTPMGRTAWIGTLRSGDKSRRIQSDLEGRLEIFLPERGATHLSLFAMGFRRKEIRDLSPNSAEHPDLITMEEDDPIELLVTVDSESKGRITQVTVLNATGIESISGEVVSGKFEAVVPMFPGFATIEGEDPTGQVVDRVVVELAPGRHEVELVADRFVEIELRNTLRIAGGELDLEFEGPGTKTRERLPCEDGRYTTALSAGTYFYVVRPATGGVIFGSAIVTADSPFVLDFAEVFELDVRSEDPSIESYYVCIPVPGQNTLGERRRIGSATSVFRSTGRFFVLHGSTAWHIDPLVARSPLTVTIRSLRLPEARWSDPDSARLLGTSSIPGVTVTATTRSRPNDVARGIPAEVEDWRLWKTSQDEFSQLLAPASAIAEQETLRTGVAALGMPQNWIPHLARGTRVLGLPVQAFGYDSSHMFPQLPLVYRPGAEEVAVEFLDFDEVELVDAEDVESVRVVAADGRGEK